MEIAKQNSLSTTEKTVMLMLLACAVYFPFFYKLTTVPLNMWDESWVAANAMGMLNHKSFWVAYYGDSPDMLNLKPPLMPWLQIICFQIFGYNSLSVRFPSAFSGVLLCAGLVWFSHRHLKTIIPGVLAALVLATTAGFARNHVARTGDYDALLALCITTYAIFFFLFTSSEYRQKTYLYLFALFLTLAVYTKGAAGFLALPALIIYTFWHGNLKRLLRMPAFYISIVGFLLATGMYYVIREHYTPGYVSTVWQGEYLGVPLTVIHGHEGPWYYYLQALISERYSFYFGLLLLSILMLFFPLRQPFRRTMQFAALVVVSMLVFISALVSKLPWYDAPLFPLAALLIGCMLYVSWQSLSELYIKKQKHIAGWLAVIVFFVIPYWQIMRNINNEEISLWDQVWFAEFMKYLEEKNPQLNKYTVAFESSTPGRIFYEEVLKHNGFTIREKGKSDDFQPGEKVLFCEYVVETALQERYELEYQEQLKMCRLAEIKDRKEAPAD